MDDLVILFPSYDIIHTFGVSGYRGRLPGKPSLGRFHQSRFQVRQPGVPLCLEEEL
jgi:hypothetical protein